MQAPGRRAAAALGWVAALTGATTALAAAAPGPAELTRAVGDPTRAVTEAGVDGAVVALLALSAWACLAWLLVSTAVSVLAHVPGRLGRLAAAVADRVAPALVRQAVAAALGVTALAGVVAPAAASAAPPSTDVPAAAAAATPLAGTAAPEVDRPGVGAPSVSPEPHAASSRLPTLDRPTGSADDRSDVRAPAPAPAAAPRRAPAAAPGLVTTTPSRDGAGPESAVVVHRGDTLWTIAARHLGPGATPAEVARAWPAWHEANRRVIGPDPDRLLPGQRLLPPA